MERLERITTNPGTFVVSSGRSLMVHTDLLDRAGLRGKVKIVVRPGEIRILPAIEPTAQEMLDGLAGCLGKEPVANYDFDLKVGGLYEAR